MDRVPFHSAVTHELELSRDRNYARVISCTPTHPQALDKKRIIKQGNLIRAQIRVNYEEPNVAKSKVHNYGEHASDAAKLPNELFII